MRLSTAIAFALVAFPAVASEDCELKPIASLALSFDDEGGAEVPVAIAGQEIMLLVDTGGLGSMLTVAAAQGLGLRPQRMVGSQFRLFGGQHIDQFVVAHDIVLGELRTATYQFQIISDGVLPKGVSGTLAHDILRAFDDDFDFANHKLNLIYSNHCPGRVIYWANDGHAELPFDRDPWGRIGLNLELDGRKVRGALDTGTSQSTMSLDLAERLFGFDEHSPDLEVLSLQGKFHRSRYPFKKLAFGGVTVFNPRIDLIADSEVHVYGAPKFLLGMNVLRQLHLYVSYQEKMLYVTAASAH